MKFYAITFNTTTFKMEAEVITIKYKTPEEQYEKLAESLNSESFDVIDYSEEIAILVDDTGFYKKNNPIFNLTMEDGSVCELAGKLLFVRNVYNEYSTDVGSITYEDIFHLRRLLDIRIIGMVRCSNINL